MKIQLLIHLDFIYKFTSQKESEVHSEFFPTEEETYPEFPFVEGNLVLSSILDVDREGHTMMEISSFDHTKNLLGRS